MILLNNCTSEDNHWIGFDVPDIPGTTLVLTRSDGSVVQKSIKGLVGVGSRSGGGRLHFGLGPSLTPTSATLYDPYGALLASSEVLTIDAYQALLPSEE